MSIARTSLFTRIWRSMCVVTHLLRGVATVIFIFPRLSPEQREETIRLWCVKILAILHVNVRARGHLPNIATRATLFVANHVSWIDVWALKSQLPMRFVAKSEVRRWPIIGWLSAQTGTLFVERNKRQETGEAINSVEDALRNNDNLCFFPEGTSTDGTTLQPFKTSLFQAAVNVRAHVCPVMIFYPHPHGGANTEAAFYGDLTLITSLRSVLSQKEIVVELDFAEPLEASQNDRRQLAEQSRAAIAYRWNRLLRTVPETAADLPAATP
ncbi:MAG: 1-acyl-sn-glycerol-3-phosphate acyltransferase [Methylobacillus sp.]|nr:1-acyl-sn-glycerol-3-phosphate acyltransferase [Methylobacillus sp.]